MSGIIGVMSVEGPLEPVVDAELEAFRPVLVDRSDAARRNVESLISAWLLSQRSAHTRDAYARDIAAWLAWLARWGAHPLDAERGHADAWARWMEKTPGPRGKPAAVTTVNRRLSAVSAFYAYCVEERVLDYNLVGHARRHKVNPKHSTTYRPSPEETVAIIAAARQDGARSWALVAMLIFSGARVSEVLGAGVADLDTDMGQRTFRVTRKGGAVEELPLVPVELVGGAIDAYLAQRADRAHVRVRDLTGPIFVDRSGQRLSRQAAAGEVKRLGTLVGCPRLTPHSLRHAFATIGTLAGVSKDHLQEWLGHQSGETTERYIARVRRYETHPGRLIAEYLGVE